MLVDHVRLARLLTVAGTVRLQANGVPAKYPFPSGWLEVFGAASGDAVLEPLMRRISTEVEAYRRAMSQENEHTAALATAERANEIARSAARRFETLFEGLPVACHA